MLFLFIPQSITRCYVTATGLAKRLIASVIAAAGFSPIAHPIPAGGPCDANSQPTR